MDAKVNENELIKTTSDYLRGSLRSSIADELTGALDPADAQICKFHGFYQQDDRDLRQQRREHLLEPYYSFMLRAPPWWRLHAPAVADDRRGRRRTR